MSSPLPFSIVYHWAEGSVPPPGYYEYTIEVNGTGGTLTFLPDYPQHTPPRWVESFACPAEAIDNLYEVLEHCGALRPIPAGRGPFAVGGARHWMEITLPSGVLTIPSRLSPAVSKRLRPVWEALQALVPQAIWEQVFARRAAYFEEHIR
jgi:hypothetical protein